MEQVQLTPCVFVVDTSDHMGDSLHPDCSLTASATRILQNYQNHLEQELRWDSVPQRQTALVTFGGTVQKTAFSSSPHLLPLPTPKGAALLGAGLSAGLALLEERRREGFQGTGWLFLITSGISDDDATPALERLKRMCEDFSPAEQLTSPPAVMLCVFSRDMDKTSFSPLTKFFPLPERDQRPEPNFFQLFEMHEEYSPSAWEGLRNIVAPAEESYSISTQYCPEKRR